MKLVIADTGPLVHLHQAAALDLLPMLGEVVVTPQSIHHCGFLVESARKHAWL